MGIQISGKDMRDAGKFMLGILAFFLLFSFAFSLVPLLWVELFYAQGTLLLLQTIGFHGYVTVQEPAILELDALLLPVGITYLCTGLLELTVIWAAIISSFGIPLRKRLLGVAAATFVIAAFNFVRIIASILIIISFGLDVGNFSHDILFKIFLFATIALFYFLWFKWATGDRPANENNRQKNSPKRSAKKPPAIK